jgi:hypothetical protein
MIVEDLIKLLEKSNPKAVVCKQFNFEYIPIDVVYEVINGEYIKQHSENQKADLLIIK